MEQQDKIVDTPAQKKKVLPITILSLAIILLIAVCGAVWYVMNQAKPSPSSTKDIPSLTVGVVGEVLDVGYPKAETAISDGQVASASQVFEGLVGSENLTKLTPLLATNWSNPNGDTSTWDFTLKQGVKFHTGRTMTAEDVKFSVEQLKKYDTSAAEQYASTIQDVTVLSPYKVRIKTDGPDPILLNKLARVYIVDSKSKTPNSALNSTGPFTLKPDAKQTDTTLSLTRFNDYHGGKVYVHDLTYKSFTEYKDMLTALKQKKVDIAGDVLNRDLAPFRSSRYQIFTDKAPLTIYLGFRTEKASTPVAKKEVREAIDLLVDKKKYLEKAGFTGTVASQLVPEQLPGYNPSIKGREQDVAQAKSLLAKAGYANGFNLSAIYFSDIKKEAIDELVSNLAQAGITLKTEQFTGDGDPRIAVDENRSDLIVSGWSSGVNDGLDFLDTAVVADSSVTDPTYLDLTKKAAVEFNPQKRLKLLQEASQYVHDQAYIVPLYHREYYQVSAQPSYYFSQQIAGVSQSFYYRETYKK